MIRRRRASKWDRRIFRPRLSSSLRNIVLEGVRDICHVTLPVIDVSGDDFYVYPNEFIPERWYSRSELVKDRIAFIPFNPNKHQSPGFVSWYTLEKVNDCSQGLTAASEKIWH